MSVDYSVRLIYGFELNQDKFQDFVNKMIEENPDFNIYEWMEEIMEQGNCEFEYENHYNDVTSDYNTVYFGITVYNHITAETLAEIEHCRREEVCDELIRIFGSGDILQGYMVPELIAIGVID